MAINTHTMNLRFSEMSEFMQKLGTDIVESAENVHYINNECGFSWIRDNNTKSITYPVDDGNTYVNYWTTLEDAKRCASLLTTNQRA